MKILIDDVKKELTPFIVDITSLNELKGLVFKHNIGLIETNLTSPDADITYKDFHKEIMKGCEIHLTVHNDYIE